MKKFFLFLFVLVFCTSTIGGSCLAAAYTPNFDLAAESVYLINLDSDMVICEQSRQTDRAFFPCTADDGGACPREG